MSLNYYICKEGEEKEKKVVFKDCDERIFDVYDESEDQLVADHDLTKLNEPHLSKDDVNFFKEQNPEVYEHFEDPESDDDPFWFQNPGILLDSNRFLEFNPSKDMTFNRNLNAIARLGIFVSLIVFFISRKTSVVYLTIAILIFTMYVHTYEITSFDNITNLVNSFDVLFNSKEHCSCSHHKEQYEEPDTDDEDEDEEYLKIQKKIKSYIKKEDTKGYEDVERTPDSDRYNKKYFKSTRELAGDTMNDRPQIFNKVQEQYLKQQPAEYFYGKNLKRKMYV